jgi:hypothetical protein
MASSTAPDGRSPVSLFNFENFVSIVVLCGAMTGEQTTLVLGLVVFGLLVLLLSRQRTRKAKKSPLGKAKPLNTTKKKRK